MDIGLLIELQDLSARLDELTALPDTQEKTDRAVDLYDKLLDLRHKVDPLLEGEKALVTPILISLGRDLMIQCFGLPPNIP